MAYPTSPAALHRLTTLIRRQRRLITSIPPQNSSNYVYPSFGGKRCLSSNAETAAEPELGGQSAYEVLGVSQSSSFAEIKASFRKLAKETHPDLAHSHSHSHPHHSSPDDASHRFIQILAAYEVKHLHWYRIGEEVSVCECRCSRARLPPSKFWLFEPRSAMHDIGGWYVETYGKNKKGKTVPAQRYWDGFDANENYDERLHPAMYLLTVAYRTLDIEELRREKKTIKDKVEANLSRLYSWFKRAAQFKVTG